MVSDTIQFNNNGLASDNQYRPIRIIDAKINNSKTDRPPSFYGLLIGVDSKSDTFNIMAFKTTTPLNELWNSPISFIMLFQNVEDSTFNCSIDIRENIVTRYPTVTGKLALVLKD